MIYQHLFADKVIYYLGTKEERGYSANHLMPAILAVSKLHRTGAIAALPIKRTLHVTKIWPLMRSPFKSAVRSLHIRAPHVSKQVKSLEIPLSKMAALSEVTISGFIDDWHLPRHELSVFRQRLKWAEERNRYQLWLWGWDGPQVSVVKAFLGNDWCAYLLRGHSALHARPNVKLFVEVERHLWNDMSPSKSLLTRVRDFLLFRSWRTPHHSVVGGGRFPGGEIVRDKHGRDTDLERIIGRMSLDDYVMRWRFNGEEFAVRQKQFPMSTESWGL